MNLITFGFSEKGTPVFLNQEPFQQVGTMYLMKAGENSVIGITLDDKAFRAARRPRKAKAEKTEIAEPKKRGRKSKTGSRKRGRKAGKPKVKQEQKAEESA